MVERFGITRRKVFIRFYLELVITAFLVSQSVTDPIWGRTSGRIRRKPAVIRGTLGALAGFLSFGFSSTYTWVHILSTGLIIGDFVPGFDGTIKC